MESSFPEEPFDSKAARENINNPPNNEITQFLQDEKVLQNEEKYSVIAEDEDFITRSEEITKNKNTTTTTQEETNIEYKQCRYPGVPFALSFERTLEVGVEEQQKQQTIRICTGHSFKEKHYWQSNANEAKKALVKKLSADPSIKTYNVDISRGGTFASYKLKATWTHHNDSCNTFQEKKITTTELVETGERWVSPEHPNCTLTDRQCLDSAPKEINGKIVHRKCWKEKILNLCQYKNIEPCPFLKNKACHEIERKCLETTPEGCALWNLYFRCSTKTKTEKLFHEEDIIGEWDTHYEENNSFTDVALKLSIFDEMQKEFELANISDPTQFQIFKGKKKKCSKSVADDLMYDCCFSFEGLAEKLKLSHCTSEEISLAEMRAKGLCHYVGKKESKFLDLWKSRDDHIFCCFPSKLSRLFHEEGRKQLGISWGNAHKPNCRGYSSEEISRINFSKLDLSELSNDIRIKEENLKNFGTKLQQRLKEKL